MALQTGYADAFLKEILGAGHFATLQKGSSPLYDSNGRFDLGLKSANGLKIEGKEGFRGAVFTLSKPGKDGFSYTFAFDRVTDPTTRNYMLCEVSRKNPAPSVLLTEGKDFNGTNLLTWRAIDFLKEAYDAVLNGKGPLIEARRKDLETMLVTSLRANPTAESVAAFSKAAYHAGRGSSGDGLTPREREDTARRQLFQGTGQEPPPVYGY